MMLRGHICSLRAVEPQDLELLCRWENDPSLWTVSGTIEPFSHYSIEQFIQEQQAGIYRCGQLRLMIDDTAGETIGAIDLFDFEPQHERAGVGILVYDPAQRGKGYGAEALALLEEYARTVLRLRQLWCNVLADNVPSLTLFERAGFRRVGVKKEWIRTPEGYKDEVLLQKLLIHTGLGVKALHKTGRDHFNQVLIAGLEVAVQVGVAQYRVSFSPLTFR